MQNTGGPYGGPPGTGYGPYGGGYPRGPPPHPRRWIYIGLAVMLALVGVALFLVLLSPETFGYHPATGIGPFGVFGGLFLIFFILFIVLWIVRIGMWSSRSRGYGNYNRGGGGGGGGRYRAFAIARERYARGEITREQYDQILQDLQRRPGYPPPP